jgi:hypothetical protein
MALDMPAGKAVGGNLSRQAKRSQCRLFDHGG